MLEIKKELLAKFLVKEKEIALKAQKIIRSESKSKIEVMSSKKRQRRKDLELFKEKTINLLKDKRENEH